MRLLALREARGLSQEDLAEVLGIRQPAYSELESAHTKLSAERELVQADFYKMSVDELLRGGGRINTVDQSYVRIRLSRPSQLAGEDDLMTKLSAPRCIIIAGPNGAGKTTFAREYLPNEAGIVNFLNTDLLAAGIAPLKPELASATAARMVLALQDNMVRTGSDFSFETTLSGVTYVEHIKEWKAAGYHITIVFLKLASTSISLKRIAARVVQGGHFVPEADVRRRFERGWNNLVKHYRSLADECVVFDLSSEVPVLVQQRLGVRGRPLKAALQVEQALRRAAKEARRIAKMHGTKVWVMQDGKLAGLKP